MPDLMLQINTTAPEQVLSQSDLLSDLVICYGSEILERKDELSPETVCEILERMLRQAFDIPHELPLDNDEVAECEPATQAQHNRANSHSAH